MRGLYRSPAKTGRHNSNQMGGHRKNLVDQGGFTNTGRATNHYQATLPVDDIIPAAPREGIVVNLPEHRMYYFPPAKNGEPRVVRTYPISTAKMDWNTPMGAAAQDVRERLQTTFLPDGAGRPLILRYDPSLDPILRVAVSASKRSMPRTTSPPWASRWSSCRCTRVWLTWW